MSPFIIANPLNVTVELHNRVTLNCSASGNPTPIIKWYKDNSAIEGPQAIGSTFEIQEATPDDRGFYRCEAINSVGNSKSNKALLLISGIYKHFHARSMYITNHAWYICRSNYAII